MLFRSSRDVEDMLTADTEAGLAQESPNANTSLHAHAPFAPPDVLQRVDETTLLLGWEAEFAPDAGREEAVACTAAGCQVLAPALWLESGEVLHLHGLGPGERWRFSRMPGGDGSNGECAEVFEVSELLALLLAKADEEPIPKDRVQ